MLQKQFYEAAVELMNEVKEKDNSTFNQAIMEFGSRQCKPSNPDCGKCPLQNSCYAFAKNKVADLPVKKKKEKPRDRYFHYFVIRQENKVFLRKRTGNDIWKNMYDFPLVEGAKKIRSNVLPDELRGLSKKIKIRPLSVLSEIKHKLSHQTIHAKFYEYSLEKRHKIPTGRLVAASPDVIHKYALPRLIDMYLKEH